MKKTTTISLARTLFHIEEDAYTLLDTYLASVRAHFSAHDDKEEILSDIEARMAERFSEDGSSIITLAIVQSVIDAMGTIGQFDATETTTETAGATARISKGLYRDEDTRVIAGVASGLGYYFGIDRTIIRILFIASVFLGGFGILAYIILWMATPLARTSAQKLEMRGEAVTLKAMSEIVRERFEELSDEKMARNAKDFGNAVERGAQNISRALWPVIRTIVGVCVTFSALLATVTVSVFAGLALSRFPEEFFGPEAAVLLHGLEYTIVIISLYLSIVLPIIIVLLWGISLLRKKSVLNKVNVLAFASVWFIALVAAGITTSRLAYRIDTAMSNDPSIARQTVTVPLESFSSIVVLDSNDIEVVRGDGYSVQFDGSKRDIDMVVAAVSDSTLTISQSAARSVECMFCDNQPISIVVTVPSVSSIALHDSSSLVADLALSDLTLLLEDSSRAVLSGNAATLSLTLKDSSYFNGEAYEVSHATVDIRDSSDALVAVSTTLSGTAQDSSSLTYTGEPKVDVKTVSSSSVRPARYDAEQYPN